MSNCGKCNQDAVKALDGIGGGDPENAHSMADDILLSVVDDDVRAAYERVVDRCRWWACA